MPKTFGTPRSGIADGLVDVFAVLTSLLIVCYCYIYCFGNTNNCIIECNMYMNGVNGIDQMISYYHVEKKTSKWTKKLFWYLLELTICNAHVIYKEKTQDVTES